jgi:cyclic pyranopterin phosphate synthase
VDARGRARMVDVGEKAVTLREAVARAEVRMRPATLRVLRSGRAAKGDVLAVARIAGILAAKRTHELVPLCHPLPIEAIEIDLVASHSRVEIEARVRVRAKTGVEMEALTAVAVAGLTVYDMLKAIDRGMVVGRIRLVRKSGGKSGVYRRREH